MEYRSKSEASERSLEALNRAVLGLCTERKPFSVTCLLAPGYLFGCTLVTPTNTVHTADKQIDFSSYFGSIAHWFNSILQAQIDIYRPLRVDFSFSSNLAGFSFSRRMNCFHAIICSFFLLL